MSPPFDTLVFLLTPGVPLDAWRDGGVLGREWALVRALGASYRRVVLVTDGDRADAEMARTLEPAPELICNDAGEDAALFEAGLGERVAAAVGHGARVSVRTNQMTGGERAVRVTRALRGAGIETRLIARGGYLASRFVAELHGPGSRAAGDATQQEGSLCRSAEIIIGTTRDMLDDLAWRHGLALPPDRLRVIPNYVLPPIDPDATRGERTILCAGQLIERKRVDLVIDAAARLGRVALRVAGDGPLRPMLESRARESGVDAEFLGRIDHEELLREMSRCSVFVQASAREGHPKTILEAMAQGATVVATHAPGVSDMIEQGVNGILTAPEAAAIAGTVGGLLEDPEFARVLGDGARRWVLGRCSLERVLELELEAHRAAWRCEPNEQPGGAAVRWTPELLKADTRTQIASWEASLHGFAKRLEPRARAAFLLGLDDPLYRMQGESAIAAEGGLHPKHRLMRYHDFFVERIGADERVIDLGCGVGALAASIAGRCPARVVGMDLSARNLELARARAAEAGLGDRLTLELGDITTRRVEARFDTIVLSNVLEHLDGRSELLRRWIDWYGAKRVLIRVPAFDREWRVPFKKELGVEWRLDLTHETEFTRGQLEAETADAGLVLEEVVQAWGELWAVARAA